MNTMKLAGLLCGAGLLLTVVVQAQDRVQVQQRQAVPLESQDRAQPTPQPPRTGVVIEGQAEQIVPNPGAEVGVQPDAQGAEFYRASELIGMTVHGADNQPIGQVKDLLIDGRTEQIRYLILDGGESLQVEGGQLLVLPWIMAEPRLVADAPDQRFIMVDVDRQRLLEAPMLTTAQFRTLPDPALFARVDAFFEVDSLDERRTLRPGADAEGRRPGPRRTAPADRPGADANNDNAAPDATRPSPGSRTQPRRPGAAQPGSDSAQPGADRPGSSRPGTQPGNTDRPRTQPNQPSRPNQPAQPSQPSRPNAGGSTQPGSSGNQGGNSGNP
jgi:sporulation protein YlmC with PRC-barrel domain